MIPKFASSDRTSEKKNENEHQNAQKAQNPQYAICNLLMYTILANRIIRGKNPKRTSERSEPSVWQVVTQVLFPLPLWESRIRLGGTKGEGERFFLSPRREPSL
jgi:hypothetical protein